MKLELALCEGFEVSLPTLLTRNQRMAAMRLLFLGGDDEYRLHSARPKENGFEVLIRQVEESMERINQ